MFKRDGGSDTTAPTEASGTVRSTNSPKKPKKETAPSAVFTCSKGCGFNTRWPEKQALQLTDKKGKATGPAKTDAKQYLCPNCDRNGMSSTLKSFP